MSKRFTETDKWRDKWFRALRPEHKLAWLYLLDNCDQAGVIDLDRELANFQIGIALDWEAFLEYCTDRVETIAKGKLWVVRFVEFQYGELSEACPAHKPALASLVKNNLSDRLFNRVTNGYAKGIPKGNSKGSQRLLDKDKDKDKVKDKDKEGVQGEDGWDVPKHLDSPDIRQLLSEFAEMRKRIKKPIKNLGLSSKVLKHFDDVAHLRYAIEFCIANEYQGLKPDYKPPKNATRPLEFADSRVATIEDMKEWRP